MPSTPFEPLLARGHRRAGGQAQHEPAQGGDALGPHRVALVRHRRRADLRFLERLFHLLEIRQQADVVAELVRRLRDRGQGVDHQRVDLPRIGLAGHGADLLEAERGRHFLVELLDLSVPAAEESQVRGLRAGRALDAAKRQRADAVLDLVQVQRELLAPQRGPLADRGELGRLVVREAQRRHRAVLLGEAGQQMDHGGQLARDQFQRVPHDDQLGVVAHVTTRGAEVDDRSGLGGRVAERVDVGHHVVAELLLVPRRLAEVDVVQVPRHLVDLALLDVQTQLLLRLGQFQPEPPPRAEFLLRTEKLGHLSRSVSLHQRARVHIPVRLHLVFPCVRFICRRASSRVPPEALRSRRCRWGSGPSRTPSRSRRSGRAGGRRRWRR